MRFWAILMMTVGSIVISFNGLVLRNIEFADNWTVIFYRALSFSSSIFLFIIFKYRKSMFGQICKIGRHGLLASSVLGVSNICFILSMTTTTVANTIFTINLIPFITAILAFYILREKLFPITVYTMVGAFFGVIIMFYGALQIGELWGNILALCTAICFSIFTIILRLNKTIDMLPCLVFSGLIAMMAAFFLKMGSLHISIHDFILCFLLGGLMSGFVNCCFVFATRHLVAAEATLFFFIESVLTPTWVWLFVKEETSRNTFVGGSIILMALLVRGIYLRFIAKPLNSDLP